MATSTDNLFHIIASNDLCWQDSAVRARLDEHTWVLQRVLCAQLHILSFLVLRRIPVEKEASLSNWWRVIERWRFAVLMWMGTCWSDRPTFRSQHFNHGLTYLEDSLHKSTTFLQKKNLQSKDERVWAKDEIERIDLSDLISCPRSGRWHT